MENLDVLLKDLTGKDEFKAQNAANYLVDSTDLELFKKLVEKSDFLFDFVKNNVCKRIEKAVNQNNFMSLIQFFSFYSSDYDDLFASILAKNANQDLTDKIFDLLLKGSNEQKAYCAKYFSYIPDTVALELLSKYAFSDDEYLAYNSAEALSQMPDDIAFDIALNSLASDDDFEKLKAVKFFVAYGRNYPLKEIFQAIKTSNMPENLAGQVPYMVSVCELINSKEVLNGLNVFNFILTGLGEILPFSDIFHFEVFEIIQDLISKNSVENQNSSLISVILLKAFSKFSMFVENQEYTFDETKDVKHEISSIYKLLKSQTNEFWGLQKDFILKSLDENSPYILEAIQLVVDFKITGSVQTLYKLLQSNDDKIICEVVLALKEFNSLQNVDFDKIIAKLSNENIIAVVESIKNT